VKTVELPTEKGEEGKVEALRGALRPDYPWLCFSCGSMVLLSPADAVLAEARAAIGDLHGRGLRRLHP
jgi:hypothetical protein